MPDEPKPIEHRNGAKKWWECCGKRLDDQKALDFHLAKSKTHKTKAKR